MTEIKEKYHEMWNFIASYFGDYREGKSDFEILKEAKKENSEQYLLIICTDISKFLIDKSYSPTEKAGLIRDTNVYFKTDDEVLAWLESVEKLLQKL